MNSAVSQFISILSLIIGVAIVAVIVSQKSNTVGVISAFAKGMSDMLKVVVSPVTGN